MDAFDYKIVTDGKVIATFLVEYDRDISMDALQENFPDAEFITINSEGT